MNFPDDVSWDCWCPGCGANGAAVNFFREAIWRFGHTHPFQSASWEEVRECEECGLYGVRTLKRAPNLCQSCGYDLFGTTSDHCPECGWQVPINMRRYLDELWKRSPTTPTDRC